MRKIKFITLLLFFIFILGAIQCADDTDDVLAPYQGNRPLKFLRITKSMTPDIQWLGGRVAAMGVNEGNRAALDSTLIWLRTEQNNEIGSYINYGSDTDINKIIQYGGVSKETLTDSTEYTFWLAEKSVFDSGLDASLFDEFSFIDSTFVMSIFLKGMGGGEKNIQGNRIVTISIARNEKMLEDIYTINWVPENIPFRQIAIRKSSLGGFKDLIWHIVTPDSLPDNIYPPVRIGEVPPGTEEAVPWPETGFEKNKVQILWMTTSQWKVDNFSPSAVGYAWFRIYPFD